MRLLPWINGGSSLVDTQERTSTDPHSGHICRLHDRINPDCPTHRGSRRPPPLGIAQGPAHPRPSLAKIACAAPWRTRTQREQKKPYLKRLHVGDMTFNPNVVAGSPRNQPTEPSIAEAMELLEWADHIVFVFPTWWGTMPAALKGFLDRVLMPGFAFEEHEDGPGWTKLLTGRSA